MIRAQRAAVLRALGEVEGADWDRPTACAPWTVKDVVAHLVDGEILVGRVYRGEVIDLGPVDPEAGIDRWRPLPGEAVRAALWQHGSATQRVLDELDAARWRAPIRALGCTTVGRLARLELFESLIHSHDLTAALGLAPAWNEERLSFAVELVMRAAPATLARRKIEPEGSLVVRTMEHAWLLAGSGAGWRVTDAEDAEDADVVLEVDPRTLVLAVTGRGDVAGLARSRGVSGDRATAERILAGWQVLAPA